ncbi:MAG: flagellar assembly protein FliW [Myxococcota bacterium]
MKIITPRFGELDVSESDMITFPEGLPGFGGKSWVLFHQSETPVVEWLQSLDEPDVALMTVAPADLMLNYNPAPSEDDLRSIHPEDGLSALSVRIIIRNDAGRLRMNLFAPLIFNVPRRLGIQVPLVGSGYPVAALWPPSPDDDARGEPGVEELGTQTMDVEYDQD